MKESARLSSVNSGWVDQKSRSVMFTFAVAFAREVGI
jgi:hypothetical protein